MIVALCVDPDAVGAVLASAVRAAAVRASPTGRSGVADGGTAASEEETKSLIFHPHVSIIPIVLFLSLLFSVYFILNVRPIICQYARKTDCVLASYLYDYQLMVFRAMNTVYYEK
jgi:hypothetical protein